MRVLLQKLKGLCFVQEHLGQDFGHLGIIEASQTDALQPIAICIVQVVRVEPERGRRSRVDLAIWDR